MRLMVLRERHKMKKIFIWMALSVLLGSPVLASSRKLTDIPPPRLLQPADKAPLRREGITFRWSSESNSFADYYDFRLYEGTQTIESGLILKERVPRDRSDLTVPADNGRSPPPHPNAIIKSPNLSLQGLQTAL